MTKRGDERNDDAELTPAEREVRQWYRETRIDAAPGAAVDRAILDAAALRRVARPWLFRMMGLPALRLPTLRLPTLGLPTLGLALSAGLAAVFVVVQGVVPRWSPPMVDTAGDAAPAISSAPAAPSQPVQSVQPARDQIDAAESKQTSPDFVRYESPLPATALESAAPDEANAKLRTLPVRPTPPALSMSAQQNAAASTRNGEREGDAPSVEVPRSPVLVDSRHERHSSEDKAAEDKAAEDKASAAKASDDPASAAKAVTPPAMIPAGAAGSVPSDPQARRAVPQADAADTLAELRRDKDTTVVDRALAAPRSLKFEPKAPEQVQASAIHPVPNPAADAGKRKKAIEVSKSTAVEEADAVLRAELSALANLLRRDDPLLPAAITRFRKRHPHYDLFAAMPSLRAHVAPNHE